MNRREPDYPIELESQFIMRLPEEPAKALRDVIKSGENFKNRLTIQIENDMRQGEVRFDHWLLHAKIVDLPTVVESLKTIDRKSVYKTADICQMMICKDELDPAAIEEETPAKNKKKDPYKVDKKFLWPHGITPPTKNVRKRRFRKTLKKKSAEAPEIEKEVKRLLRADNEAVSVTWEVIKEESDHKNEQQPISSGKPDKVKMKKETIAKMEATSQSSSKVEDIFGGALSDSDLEDENINVDIEDSHLSSYGDRFSDSSAQGPGDFKNSTFATHFSSDMFSSHRDSHDIDFMSSASTSKQHTGLLKGSDHYETDDYMSSKSNDNSNLSIKLQQLSAELEELKQRRQRTQLEISGMENMTLRQRFQDILQTLNKDIRYKEIEYQKLQSMFK